MSTIYPPSIADSRVAEFIDTYSPDPTGAVNDDFRTAMLAYLEIEDEGQDLEEVWKAYLIDRFGYHVGQHINHYTPEEEFEFDPEEPET